MASLLSLETAIGSVGRGDLSSPVILGKITFVGVEVPSLIQVGADMALVVQRLVGGGRVIQTLGGDPSELRWSAFFVGPSAMQRAKAVEQIRNAGLPVACSFAGLRLQVVVKGFSYGIQDKGAVLPYTLVLERVPTDPTTSTPSASALSNLVGPTIGNALTGLSTTVANISSYASELVSQGTTVAGQITPLASMIGAGGLVAQVTDKLTIAQGLASAGTNFAQAPAAAASMITSLQSAGSGLTTLISQAGTNLEGISGSASSGDMAGSTAALSVAQVNGDILTAATDAAAQVNTAMVYTQTAAGLAVTPALVHA